MPSPIETERLKLVHPSLDHLPAYVAYCASPRSVFVGGPFDEIKAFEKLCAMSGHWALRGFGRFVITEKGTGRPIGHVGALQLDTNEQPEMTWTLWDGDFEGKGYAFEAVTGYLTQSAGSLGVDHMLIRIEKDNERSLNLAKRLDARRDPTATTPDWMPNCVTFVIDL